MYCSGQIFAAIMEKGFFFFSAFFLLQPQILFSRWRDFAAIGVASGHGEINEITVLKSPFLGGISTLDPKSVYCLFPKQEFLFITRFLQ